MATSTKPYMVLAIPHARYWPDDEKSMYSAARSCASANRPVKAERLDLAVGGGIRSSPSIRVPTSRSRSAIASTSAPRPISDNALVVPNAAQATANAGASGSSSTPSPTLTASSSRFQFNAIVELIASTTLASGFA